MRETIWQNIFKGDDDLNKAVSRSIFHCGSIGGAVDTLHLDGFGCAFNVWIPFWEEKQFIAVENPQDKSAEWERYLNDRKMQHQAFSEDVVRRARISAPWKVVIFHSNVNFFPEEKMREYKQLMPAPIVHAGLLRQHRTSAPDHVSTSTVMLEFGVELP